MRWSLVFSLLFGVAALLKITEYLPIAEPADEPPGRTAMTMRADNASVAPDARATAPAVVADRGRLYRWRDEGGGIHFQTDPPPPDVRAQVIPFVRRQTTVARDVQASLLDATPDAAGSVSALLSVYTPRGFDDLMRRVEETAIELRRRNEYVEVLEKQL